MVTLRHHPAQGGLIGPRIEILGVFGSGKTTLAQSLAANGQFDHLGERHEQNPFWDARDFLSAHGYLGYDLHFLLQHYRLAATASRRSLSICDWSFVSDRLWASMRLGEDLNAYQAAFESLTQRVGPPLGYIYLRTPVATIASRIVSRGRAPERALIDQLEDASARLEQTVSTLPSRAVITIADSVVGTELKVRLGLWEKANGGR